MSSCDMRLAGICKDCMKRLGIDERLTTSLSMIQVSQLPELDPKLLAGIQFPGTVHIQAGHSKGAAGTTKITYKIAKTVKETIDDAASNTSHPGSRGGSSASGSSKH